MFRLCNENDYKVLMQYLKKDEILNTFIIADINIYGFHKEFQKVYMEINSHEECVGVALVFHNNLIITGALDKENLMSIITSNNKINNVMGEGKLVEDVQTYMSYKLMNNVSLNFLEKQVYTLNDKNKLHTNKWAITVDMEGVDEAYNFLMEQEEIKQLYSNKDMMINRISSKEGIHLIVRKDKKVIAHINSAAGTKISTMMGGLAVDKKYRNQGFAKEIVSQLCYTIMEENKIPCVFAGINQEHNLFIDLGFTPYKIWGTLGINR